MGHYDNAGFPLRHMWSQWTVSREGTHLREGFLRLTEHCVEEGRAEEAGGEGRGSGQSRWEALNQGRQEDPRELGD